MTEFAQAFAPCYSPDSRVLILGSFPSVKSRQQNFYYGNRQNSFWKILSSFFGDSLPETVEDKKKFLFAHKIALWDMVESCTIDGSSDASIKNFKVVNLQEVLQNCPIEVILLNGGKATELYRRYCGDIAIPAYSLPSTSPANTNPKEEKWYEALGRAFGRS